MPDIPISRIVKWGLFGCFFGLACIIGIITMNSTSKHNDTMTTHRQMLQELQAELETVSSEAKDVTEQIETVRSSISSVKEIGDEIATLENEYMELVYKERTTRAEEDQDYGRMNEICVKMDEYFGKNTMLRSIWYGGDMTQLPDAQWKFQTNYNYAGNTIPVLWVFSNDDESILAYVTAEYNSDTNVFDKYEKHVTVAGNTFMPYTENPNVDSSIDESFDPEVYADSIFNILGSISENFTDEYMESREDNIKWNEEHVEDLQDISKARAELLEQYEGGE